MHKVHDMCGHHTYPSWFHNFTIPCVYQEVGTEVGMNETTVLIQKKKRHTLYSFLCFRSYTADSLWYLFAVVHLLILLYLRSRLCQWRHCTYSLYSWNVVGIESESLLTWKRILLHMEVMQPSESRFWSQSSILLFNILNWNGVTLKFLKVFSF